MSSCRKERSKNLARIYNAIQMTRIERETYEEIFIPNSQVLDRQIDLFSPRSILILNDGLNIDFSQIIFSSNSMSTTGLGFFLWHTNIVLRRPWERNEVLLILIWKINKLIRGSFDSHCQSPFFFFLLIYVTICLINYVRWLTMIFSSGGFQGHSDT